MIIALPLARSLLSPVEVAQVDALGRQLLERQKRMSGRGVVEGEGGPRLVHIFEEGLTEQSIEQLIMDALEVQIRQNQFLLRRGQWPALFDAGARWRPEPAGSPVDEFAHARLVRDRGWGDCDDLVAWRVAELRNHGEVGAAPYLYQRERQVGPSRVIDMHVQTWRGDGRPTPIEDTSRLLGM